MHLICDIAISRDTGLRAAPHENRAVGSKYRSSHDGRSWHVLDEPASLDAGWG